MKNILFAAVFVLILALTACSSDNQSASDEKSDNSQSETTQNEQQDKSNNEQGSNDKDKENKSEEAPAQYSVFIEKKTFKFEDKQLDIPFKVAKNGEPLTGGKLGLMVKVPIGDIPFEVEELKNGKYNGKVQVPKPGVYQASVFKMEGKRRNILGQFQLKFEK
ncbi:hypothetical protein [Virgibacillus ihumii]|uniref:hypothetical protein n=1 Tax=Virgibacillus ihumii TaxID=2686091 RepID=UPI00157D0FAB|nr:hypothetical protein [Virgibacillus ihumii]